MDSKANTQGIAIKKMIRFLIENINHMPHGAKEQATSLINWTAVGAAMSSFFGILPGILSAVAAFFSIVWLGLQIYAFIKDRWFV